jgi:hypothetical protein
VGHTVEIASGGKKNITSLMKICSCIQVYYLNMLRGCNVGIIVGIRGVRR